MLERQTGVGVLDKVVGILACFEGGRSSLSPQDIARMLEISVPTAYRLASAMAAHGLLEIDDRSFRLGMRLATLGARASKDLDIRRVALPHLRALADTTGENAHLSIRHATFRVLVEFVAGHKSTRPFSYVGETLPLGVGASGLVLIAWLPWDEARELAVASCAALDIPFDVDALRGRLDKVRAEGFAISQGDRHAEVSGLAAPVFDASGQVAAAVSVVGPRARMTAKETKAHLAALLKGAANIAATLGYRAGS